MEEIFEIRSCIEIIWETVFTCQKTQPTDDYKEFVNSTRHQITHII